MPTITPIRKLFAGLCKDYKNHNCLLDWLLKDLDYLKWCFRSDLLHFGEQIFNIQNNYISRSCTQSNFIWFMDYEKYFIQMWFNKWILCLEYNEIYLCQWNEKIMY